MDNQLLEETEDMLAEVLEAEVSSEDEEFRVTDENSCNWVVRKIVSAEDELKRIKSQYNARKKELERRIEFFEKRFGHEMEQWTSQNLPYNRKSIKLQNGTVGFRKSRETIKIVDKEENIEWVKNNCPDALRQKEYTTKTEQIEHLQETGEMPAGVDLQPAENKFYIK